MALEMKDLERFELGARRQIDMKVKCAAEGNDWVVDHHIFNSFELLELVALARLGHPIWMNSRDKPSPPTEAP